MSTLHTDFCYLSYIQIFNIYMMCMCECEYLKSIKLCFTAVNTNPWLYYSRIYEFSQLQGKGTGAKKIVIFECKQKPTHSLLFLILPIFCVNFQHFPIFFLCRNKTYCFNRKFNLCIVSITFTNWDF